MKEIFETNRKAWDEKVEVHKHSEMYDLAGFKKGKTSLNQIELEAIGNEIAGKTMLHLQCHFGQDSLSWARMGAKVTGVDMSPKSLQLARALNEELGLEVRFVESNVLELKDHLSGQFDFVFTSYGTYTWLPDLLAWASVIEHFLKPGGTFFMADFHPTLYLFDYESQKIAYNYFDSGGPIAEEVSGSYADRQADIHHKQYFWTHSLHETIGPLLKKGLILKEFMEYDYSPYNCFENMIETETGKFKFRGPEVRLPHVFSLKMQKPKVSPS